ncbi:hypothetical protein QBC47DRAFT_387360 [Echria macrotheca]|uniref:Secreted protein n=1 Tax=Echria macrotheca TaxID=438768 RepID=A0AAJ0B737_9PEZI|nr:hypothetical protein QBC47DRAFT_387360 [Echria macrotheca]
MCPFRPFSPMAMWFLILTSLEGVVPRFTALRGPLHRAMTELWGAAQWEQELDRELAGRMEDRQAAKKSNDERACSISRYV